MAGMKWVGVLLAAALLAGCGDGVRGNPDGLAFELSRAGLPADAPEKTFDALKIVCTTGHDGLVDAAQTVAANDVAERTMSVAIAYMCPDRSREFDEIVDRYRDMVGR